MRTFTCSKKRDCRPSLAIGIGIAIDIAIGFVGAGKTDSDADFIRDSHSNVDLTMN